MKPGTFLASGAEFISQDGVSDRNFFFFLLNFFLLSLGLGFPLAPWAAATGGSGGPAGLARLPLMLQEGLHSSIERRPCLKDLGRKGKTSAARAFYLSSNLSILLFILKHSELNSSSGILKNGINCTTA